jgi:hypothetical protein
MANPVSVVKAAVMGAVPMGAVLAMVVAVSAAMVRERKTVRRVVPNVQNVPNAVKVVANCAALKVPATIAEALPVSAVVNALKAKFATARRRQQRSAQRASFPNLLWRALRWRPVQHEAHAVNAVREASAMSDLKRAEKSVRKIAMMSEMKRVPIVAMAVDHEAQKALMPNPTKQKC